LSNGAGYFNATVFNADSAPEIFWISLVTADKNWILFSILRFCRLVRLLNFGITSLTTIIIISRFCSSDRFFSSICPSSCSKAKCPVGSMYALTMFPVSAGSADGETGIEGVKGCMSLRSAVKNSATKSFSSDANSLIWPTSSAMLFMAAASSWMDISWSMLGFGSVTTTFVVVCATGVCCVTLFSWLKVDQFMLMVSGEKSACMFQDLHTCGF